MVAYCRWLWQKLGIQGPSRIRPSRIRPVRINLDTVQVLNINTVQVEVLASTSTLTVGVGTTIIITIVTEAEVIAPFILVAALADASSVVSFLASFTFFAAERKRSDADRFHHLPHILRTMLNTILFRLLNTTTMVVQVWLLIHRDHPQHSHLDTVQINNNNLDNHSQVSMVTVSHSLASNSHSWKDSHQAATVNQEAMANQEAMVNQEDTVNQVDKVNQIMATTRIQAVHHHPHTARP